jgi:hypothetical protein
MKRRFVFTFVFSLSLALSACVRTASTPIPSAKPAGNVPAATTTVTPGPANPCHAADLETSSNSNATAKAVVIGITLVNKTGEACILSSDPQIALLDANGSPLPVEYISAEVEQTPPLPAEIRVIPGESAIVSMVWKNPCPPHNAKITIQLTFPDGESLRITPGTIPGLRCDDKTAPSTVTVSPYSYPP